jgi:hypothetical protein
MSRLIIVCTYDGLEMARALERVLAAEDHAVEILYGAAAQAQPAAARNGAEAVVLIWSRGAGGSAYIAHWRRDVEAARLIEVAVCEGWPTHQRRWPVIDFSNWKGRRGSAAWRALAERLRVIARANDPDKPGPTRAAMALGAISLAAVGGALLVRVHETPQQAAVAPTQDQFAALAVQDFDGQGGPLRYAEPAGMDDPDVELGPLAPRLSPIAANTPRLLHADTLAPPLRARSAGLLGRIADMAEPLLTRADGDGESEEQAGP